MSKSNSRKAKVPVLTLEQKVTLAKKTVADGKKIVDFLSPTFNLVRDTLNENRTKMSNAQRFLSGLACKKFLRKKVDTMPIAMMNDLIGWCGMGSGPAKRAGKTVAAAYRNATPSQRYQFLREIAWTKKVARLENLEFENKEKFQEALKKFDKYYTWKRARVTVTKFLRTRIQQRVRAPVEPITMDLERLFPQY